MQLCTICFVSKPFPREVLFHLLVWEDFKIHSFDFNEVYTRFHKEIYYTGCII